VAGQHPGGDRDLCTRGTVLLADDHAVLREGLRQLLEATGRLDVVGLASDGLEAVEMASRLQPRVVVMDIWMPRLSGIEATRRIHASGGRSRVLIFSVHESQRYVEQAMRAGASGYVVKTAEPTELIQAIDAVVAGRTYISPAIAQQLVAAFSGGSAASALTSREMEVLRLIAEGPSSKEIAAQLGVSVRTVDSHRARLMQKLGIRKATGLVRFAIREGLIAP
jgi:DNA-binding NarL/FixJ family response regulator